MKPARFWRFCGTYVVVSEKCGWSAPGIWMVW
jgi:hypothetical protein